MYRRKIVERVSEEENLLVVEDTLGNYHILNTPQDITINPEIEVNIPPPEETYRESIFLNSITVNNFPNTINFYPIPNIVTGQLYLRYTVPTNQKLIIKYINIIQTREGLSLLGITKNGNLYASFPFYREKEIKEDILISSGVQIEFLVKPGNSNTRIGMIVRGTLITP